MIGVISDTHGHKEGWLLAKERFFAGAEFILHAGDVLNSGPKNPRFEDFDPQFLLEDMNGSEIPILIAKGNCDSEVDEMLLAPPISTYTYVRENGLTIVTIHGHSVPGEEDKLRMAKKLGADIFITGHTHQYELKKREGIIFLNPGSSYRRIPDDRPRTVALINEKEVAIYSLESNLVLASVGIG